MPSLFIMCSCHRNNLNIAHYNSIAMSNTTHSAPQAPFGIDPEVLSKINTLFETPEAIVTPSPRRLPTETTQVMEAWWANTGSPSADQTVVEGVADEEQNEDGDFPDTEQDDFEFNDDFFLKPPSENDIDSNIELYDLIDLLPPECSPATQPIAQQVPQPVDPRAPRIIARYIFPSAPQPGTPPPLPPQKPETTWPTTLPNLIAMFYRFIVELIKDIFCSSGPLVVEYSDRQIRQNANDVRVETQAVEYEVPASTASEITKPETVVAVVALFHVGNTDQREAIPIIAKSKRVRQILKDDGYDLVEDMYIKQIKQTLAELSEMAYV
jgi:hypothetical protein